VDKFNRYDTVIDLVLTVNDPRRRLFLVRFACT